MTVDEGKIEAPAEGAPSAAVNLTEGYSVRKTAGDGTASSRAAKKVDPSQIGASGLASSMRSTVTKSFRTGTQAGFDEAGDNTKDLEPITILSSARASNMVSIVSTALGEDPDTVKHFLCVPLTNNVKALFIMMVMFAVISIGQYFAADYANSQALKADVVSMGMDAVSYFGNIMGESSDIPAQKIILQLFFSMVSMVLLVYFNTTTLMESIEIIKGVEEDEEDAPGVEGTIVIIFAGLGLVFDAICLYAYYHYAKIDAEIEYNEMMKLAEAEGKDMEQAKAQIQKPEINMLSALLHVSADLFRSTATFILGILLVANALNEDQQSLGDAWLAVIIGITIYLAAIYAVYEWYFASREWWVGLAQGIEVQCPECEAQIEIKPDKAGHGKAADAFLA
jgi:Co/Zn/Cd efflux system component